jgi:ferredoxin
MSTPETLAADAATPAPPALPDTTANGRARRAAMLRSDKGIRRPTSLISYESTGRVAVIGHAANAAAAAERLEDALECTVLVTAGEAPESADSARQPPGKGPGVRTISAAVSAVRGHLGAFEIDVIVNEETQPLAPSLLTAHRPFDIVLDLCDPPFIRAEVPPPGYFAPRRDPHALEHAVEDIPGLVGEFEKPKYFNYNADICAHGRSGITGCTRCMEACPTDAIRSLEELIEVDPFLCQGGGSCTTACPTGAITYAYPAVSDLLTELRGALATYGEAGGEVPCVLLHDAERGRAWVGDAAESLPENLIPYELEEIGAAGLDAWLALVAYGARQVVLWCPANVPASVKSEIEHQLGVAGIILEGMGYPKSLLVCADEGDDEWISAVPARDALDVERASFAAVDEKRTNIRLAVDHLYARAPAPVDHVALNRGAPFGEVLVNRDTCTLCMACVSVCPASALSDGGNEPKLKFIEWNCVQCGLCETACPEDAITTAPRFLYDAEQRRESRLLNEDTPFNCIVCGKAFATTSLIMRMREKLSGHWMFQKPEAVERLQMCEDCRVKDMFKDGGGLLDVHDDS